MVRVGLAVLTVQEVCCLPQLSESWQFSHLGIVIVIVIVLDFVAHPLSATCSNSCGTKKAGVEGGTKHS